MNAPTVSVIMATYNHAPYVKQAIESVLQQKEVSFEFLIADDGSTDQTRETVASIQDPRIQFFPNTTNRGACIVTNELIQQASGEFIALINSDDYWTDRDKLAYQVEIMRAKPNVGACFGRARFVDKNGNSIDKSSLSFGTIFDQENRSQGQWLRRFFELGNCICHPTMLIRKSCYGELGLYNNRLRQLPDFEMWIRLFKSYDIFISDRELINFRILPGENASSQTATNSIRTMNEHFLIGSNFFDNVTRNQLMDGFEDLLLVKELPTDEHIEIEKVRLYFCDNKWLSKPYEMIGLLKMHALLSSARHNHLMTQTYKIDDRWFQQKMSEVDVLRPRIIAELREKAVGVRATINKITRLFRN
jgi:glycosyltransferase involved in cell wall biosynthesis